MTPLQTYKKNRSRLDLRTYTREFEKLFKGKDVKQTLPGSVYAFSYSPSLSVTDKYHVTPVIYSLGRFRDNDMFYTRGVNLLYLNDKTVLDILEEGFKHFSKKPDNRVLPVVNLHDYFMKLCPYAFKNFEERRINSISEVSVSEWGMIPLLRKELWGTFNPLALNEDFSKEMKMTVKKDKSKKKVEKPLNTLTEEETEAYFLGATASMYETEEISRFINDKDE